jgi:hypothetical protein
MSELRKYATLLAAGAAGSTPLVLPMRKAGTADLAVAADWTPVAGDVQVSIDEGAFANAANLPTYVNGRWRQLLTAAELTGKSVVVRVVDAAAKAVDDEIQEVLTFGNAAASYPDNYTLLLIGTPGSTGLAGDVAAIGSGAGGVSAVWNFNNNLTSADPGNGKFRFNSAAIASVTQIYMDRLTDAGGDFSNMFRSMAAGDLIFIQEQSIADNWARFTLSSPPADQNGWWILSVTYTASAGVAPGNNTNVSFLFEDPPAAPLDPWATLLPGSYGAGTAGNILPARAATGDAMALTPAERIAVSNENWGTLLPGSFGVGTAGSILPARAATGDAMALTVAERSAVANALLDLADAIEAGLTLRGSQRLALAALAGLLDGAGTATETMHAAVPSGKPRITASVDASGNRTAITRDAS